MKILQVTNIVSHHQLPLARELCKLVGEDNFLFAATETIDQDRLKNGWQGEYPEKWIVHPNNSTKEKELFDRFWDEADVVLCGERLISKMQKRVDNKKLCFYMSERWWKPPVGIFRLCHPRHLKIFLNFRRLSKSSYFHYLPTGPFAARDMALFTSMQGRTWQWGYFTEIPNSKRNFSKSIGCNATSILWVGRMLKWKRVDLLIKALYRLKNEGEVFHLTLIGEGPESKQLKKLADKLLGKSYCEIKKFIPSVEVPAIMAKNNIYVLPSNGYEGWGAVINEAMSVGCAVVSSDKAGAAASLIEHGVNGLLFKSGSESSLYKNLKKLILSRELSEELGSNARSTIIDFWQPSVVAARFVNLSLALSNDSKTSTNISGPLSEIK